MSLSDAVERAVPDRVSRSADELFDPVAERPSLADALRTTARVCGLLVGLAVLAWASGYPYLFPSLGPSAYALAVNPGSATSQPKGVFGAHLFGVVGGLVAYHALAAGLTVVQAPPAASVAALRLGASALLSVGLTSVGMLMTDLRHPPACATTLIVSLGLLTTPLDAAIILAAVCLLVGSDLVLPDFGGVENPPR